MTDLVFYIFSVVTVLFAVGVVVAKEAVMSAFSLVLTFFGLAAIYLLMGHPLMAAIQVLIYTGAIVVLFVFVVMLIRIKDSEMGLFALTRSKVIIVGVSCWLVTFSLLQFVKNSTMGMRIGTVGNSELQVNMRDVALRLFTDYLWPFEMLSIFMLAVIVCIFIVAKKPTEQEP